MPAAAAAHGRFAPSPTGPLHFGSLVAALGSLLSARRHGGRWFVRIEDLDTPRNAAGAADSILRDLDRFGMHWDGDVVHQSRRPDAYAEALEQLADNGWTFACGCSRRDLVAGVYPGTCREGLPPGRTARSIRLRVEAATVEFIDAIQGPVAQSLEREVGDFVVLRADGVVAYHLAVVVDDAQLRVNEGGARLGPARIHSAPDPDPASPRTPPPRSMRICRWAVGAGRHKLSKQNLARPIASEPPGAVLVDALEFLGQRPPRNLARAPAAEG